MFVSKHSNYILFTIKLTHPGNLGSSYLPCLLIPIPVSSSARNQTQAVNDYLTSSSSDTSRAWRAPTDAAMTFSTASSSEKRSKKRKPASSSRRRTLPFSEEANSPALACKVPDRARVKAVSSQLDTSLSCHISTFCIFASFHFDCKAAKLCGGYFSFILSFIHSTVPLCKKPFFLKSPLIF